MRNSALILMFAAVSVASQTSPARLEIRYPLDGSIFPPEITAPLIVWKDPSRATAWRIEIAIEDGGPPLRAVSKGDSPPIGEIDPAAIAQTNQLPSLAAEFDRAHSWRPGAALWEEIKRRSAGRTATVRISGAVPGEARALSVGAVRLTTSADPVGAPIFYRDVPLMPSETRKGVIKPLAPDAIRLVQWRLRDIASTESRVVLKSLPTCANCHSFSSDGKTLGMDLDGPDSDKGTYAISPVQPEMSIRRQDVMTWNSFEGRPQGSRTIGFMSQISPSGQHVVSTVNEEVYTANFRDYRFLQVFYPTRGILAVFSRATGRIEALPGADDPRFVHTNAVWSPDGESIVFARAPARAAYPPGGVMAASANDANELPVQYDLYRIPFNGGRGGRAEPVRGASQNGRSNSFPKISPDGKWLVYVQSRNGQLMRPDSELWIVPASGGQARRMRCNTPLMNSWHSFSPNGRWMVFSSKSRSPYTQMFLTHIGEDGADSPAILIENATAANRAVNIPEFVNIQPGGLLSIGVPAAEFYRLYDRATEATNAGHIDEAIALWREALALEPEDARALNNLGVALSRQGRLEEAETMFRRAIEIRPAHSPAHYNLGGVLAKAGRTAEAIESWERALRLMPDFAGEAAETARSLAEAPEGGTEWQSWRQRIVSAYNDRGVAAANQGRTDEAETSFRKALELDQDFAQAHYNLGRILARKGQFEAAAAHWSRATDVKPDYSEAHFSLAGAEAQLGRWASSLEHWLEGLRSAPGFAPALMRAAWILATASDAGLRDGEKAVGLAEEAVRLSPAPGAEALDALAAAYAEAGRFAEASATARKALGLASGPQAAAIRERLASYESGKPWREPKIRR